MDIIKKNLENPPPGKGVITTSMRLSRFEEIEEAVEKYGFKNRSHFFQLAADALLRVAAERKQLEWPPKFKTVP